MPVPVGAGPLPAPCGPTSVPAPVAPASPLPRKYRYPPELEGEVEDVSPIQILVAESFASRATRIGLAGVLVMFRPMMVAAGWALRGKTPAERRAGSVLTIRRADGGAEQARIEGELVGALPRRGDHLSLWGRRSYGVLMVRDGYNHSVHGEIRIG